MERNELRALALALGAALMSGCVGAASNSPGTGGSGGTTSSGGHAGTGAAPTGSGGTGTSTGGTTSSGGSAGHGSGGSGGTVGTAGTGQVIGTAGTTGSAGAGVAGHGSGGTGGGAGTGVLTSGTGGSTGGVAVSGAGGAGGAAHVMDHCTYGEAVDSRDMLIADMPDQWTSPKNGAIDLVVPSGVLQWMHGLEWEQSHDAWHDIRRCKNGAQTSYGINVCAHTDLIPADQECSDAEDGLEFLVMHRHMIQALKQAFPQHADLFAGFPHFPFNATDVPQQWQGRFQGWSTQITQTANTLEAIEQNVSMFATDGDLGKYIQCGGMSTGASSIHGALHFEWVVSDSPYSLGSQPVNIDNYMFWKLHGWIDEIWERYRVAKGETDTDPKLVQALHDQCVQMDQLGALFSDSSTTTQPTQPLPTEYGYFVDNVRPIFESVCVGCHGDSSPEASMSLAGNISNAQVVSNLVNHATLYGGQFKRIVPNSTSQSWLYLKVSGMAQNAGCQGSMCNTEVMPPTGQVTLTQDQLTAIANWINMGAPAPTTSP